MSFTVSLKKLVRLAINRFLAQNFPAIAVLLPKLYRIELNYLDYDFIRKKAGCLVNQ